MYLYVRLGEGGGMSSMLQTPEEAIGGAGYQAIRGAGYQAIRGAGYQAIGVLDIKPEGVLDIKLEGVLDTSEQELQWLWVTKQRAEN